MDQDFETTSQILTRELVQEPKVLLVDDDELVLARLEGLIAEAGFEVSTALDANAALAALQKTFTPIVITDRNMPGMDGVALCRHIRRQTWPGYIYRINDRYGHAAGDHVLREFVRRVSGHLRQGTDWCARIGGEEFVVVLAETGSEGAAVVAEKLRGAVAQAPIKTGNAEIEATVSIGVAALKLGGEDTVESLLSRADDCLYLSKEKGRNRVTLPTG